MSSWSFQNEAFLGRGLEFCSFETKHKYCPLLLVVIGYLPWQIALYLMFLKKYEYKQSSYSWLKTLFASSTSCSRIHIHGKYNLIISLCTKSWNKFCLILIWQIREQLSPKWVDHKFKLRLDLGTWSRIEWKRRRQSWYL